MRRALIASAVTLFAWLLFAWPLPQHLASGIPSSDRNVEKYHAREMIPGDHLQLLYHFHLLSDMVSGAIPWLHNPYEFNLGEAGERAVPDPYYVPFSLLYAAVAPFAGAALGWNIAGFAGLWLTFWWTWRLTRRYTADGVAAWLAASIGLMLPYRWITLLTGSPTGFGMTWVPALLLGLDVAVRDRRAAGGWLAGLALLFGYGSDLHVFFFQILAAPVWCAFAWVAARGPRDKRVPLWAETKGIVYALLPAMALGVVALALGQALHQDYTGTDVARGRDLRDVARFSPLPIGLFSWWNDGVSNHVFFGVALMILLVAGVGAALAAAIADRGDRKRSRTDTDTSLGRFLLLLAGLAWLLALALGTNGPGDGWALRACRAVVPRFEMIRQPAKAFCLLPTVAAVAAAPALTVLGARFRRRRAAVTVMGLAAALVIVESRFQISPTICLLRPRQAAYQAVADEARSEGRVPRALVLPLWPGDSHYTSLYEYDAALHRVRMVNGYSPAIRDRYFEDVFLRLESANQGLLTDAQLDWLLERGIRYVIFQEGPFPEKVSPFPAGVTLSRLLDHPRLRRIERDQLAWAFGILDAPAPRDGRSAGAAAAQWPYRFPARVWEWELVGGTNAGPVVAAPDAQEGRCRRLGAIAARVETSRPVAGLPDLRWTARVRGDGVLRARAGVGTGTGAEDRRESAGAAWRWVDVPAALGASDFNTVWLELAAEGGRVDVDAVALIAGEWPAWNVGDELVIPAVSFFRAGYTDPADGGGVLRRDSESAGTVLYGPRLPLGAGRYRLTLDLAAAAPAGVRVGTIAAPGESAMAVRAGAPCLMEFEVADNRLWSFEFLFTRRADVTIESVRLTRVR
jgi:hypothetical protein